MSDSTGKARRQWLAAAAANAGEISGYLGARMAGLRFAAPEGSTVLAPLVLAPATVAAVHRTAFRLTGLVTDLGMRIAAGDARRLAAAVGFTGPGNPAARLIGNAPSWGWSPAIVRPDMVLVGGAPKLIELNFNSTLSGSIDSDALARAFAGLSGQLRLAPPRVEPGFTAARGRLALDVAAAANLDTPPRIALVYSGRERARRYSRFVDEEFECLSRQGLDVILAEIGELCFDRTALSFQGRPVDVAFRVYNTESALRLGYDPDLLADLEQVRVTTFLATAECLLFTSNALLAMLFDEIHSLPARDQRLVTSSVPWTVRVTDRRVVRDGIACDLGRHAVERQSDLVLKPLNGHSGDRVVFGCDVSAAEWSDALESAFRAADSCLQERVVPDTTSVPVHDHCSGRASVHRLPSVLGPYRLGRHTGGIAVRHPTPGSAEHAINWDNGVMHNVALTA